MSFAHESIAALPVSGNADAALIRAMATRRIAYCLASTELASDFTATDPDTGVRPLYLVKSAVLYQLDATDSTTAAGATCLVTADGLRYKSDSVSAPWSVLDKDTTAQPASPTVGDRYLVPVAATGAAWSGKDNQVAEYTAAGWFFSTIAIGRPVYVRDEDAFYYRNNAGTWTSGFGAFLIPAGSIAPSKMLWDGRVQDQTTNTPPSAAQGVAYIIGSAPTGAWSGNAGKIALREASGTGTTYVIYTPYDGQVVYDVALNTQYVWSATASAWKAQFSGYSEVISAANTANSTLSSTGAGDNGGLYSPTTPPTISGAGRSVVLETLTADVQADVAGQTIEVEYGATLWGGSTAVVPIRTNGSGSWNNRQIIIAAYVDNEVNAREWQLLFQSNFSDTAATYWEDAVSALQQIRGKFAFTLGDTNLHTIKIRFHVRMTYGSLANQSTAIDVARRSLIVRKRR